MRLRLAIAGGLLAAAAATAPALAAPAAPATTTVQATPEIHPGQVYFKGHLCMASDHHRCIWAARLDVSGHKVWTILLSSHPDDWSTFEAIYVWHVSSSDHHWPFIEATYDEHFNDWPIVNMELMIHGRPSAHCLVDAPLYAGLMVLLGDCSREGANSSDKDFSHMVWKPGDRIIEPNLTNRSTRGATAYCQTEVPGGVVEKYKWQDRNVDTCFKVHAATDNHWIGRK